MNEWEWQLLEEKLSVEKVMIGDVEVRAGDRVRLRPRQGGDVLDIALAGQVGCIESIEQDYEGKNHVCVVLDEDPGRDLGLLRQPGHRFFFATDEVEPLSEEETVTAPTAEQPSILVAGIGNIFQGDDGFGVEVVRRLATRRLPKGVRVADFGIRGLDLAYALQDGYETTILIDAYSHGREAGSVSLVEPDLRQLELQAEPVVEGHGMHPLKVLRLAATMSGSLNRILLVGCEPANLGGDEGTMGLSVAVEAAVEEAVSLIMETVDRIMRESEQNYRQNSLANSKEEESRGRE